MGFVFKTVGYIFVLIGFLAPLGCVYLYLTREAQVKFYIGNAAAFGNLSDVERKSEETLLREVAIPAQKNKGTFERDINAAQTVKDAIKGSGK